ncbi:MAG: hypothetical protein LBU12_05630, partial [Deltaproteobacteria bacterium]|nr:hypothetical protein [Deltaproteobacteria bacterium]
MTDSTLTDSTVIDLPAAVSPDAGSSAIGSPLADAPSTDSSAAGSPLASSPSPDASPAVVLTPSAALIFAGHKGDWREKLFDLGAARETAPDPALRFWRSFAELFVGGLCRLPDDFGLERLAPPAEAQLQSLAAGAPPMAGGEYLSADSLAAVWGRLAQWTAEAAGRDWPDWLARRAPQWRRVGRVTFHLAENRSDPDKPFAFMASYVTSLTAEGRDRHLPLGQALRRYAGEGDRPALLRLLSPVRAAAEKLPWVAKMVADGTLYAPQAFTIGRAYRFLSDASSMEESGLTVRIPDWWRRRPQVKVAVSVGDGRPPSLGLKSLLDWDVSLALGDERLTPDEAAELLSAGSGLVFFKGQWLEVDPDRLSEALEHWRRVKASSGDGLGFIQAMRLLAGLPVEGRGGALELPEPGPWVGVRAGRALGELLAELRGPKAGRAPAGLKAELRPYQ